MVASVSRSSPSASCLLEITLSTRSSFSPRSVGVATAKLDVIVKRLSSVLSKSMLSNTDDSGSIQESRA